MNTTRNFLPLPLMQLLISQGALAINGASNKPGLAASASHTPSLLKDSAALLSGRSAILAMYPSSHQNINSRASLS